MTGREIRTLNGEFGGGNGLSLDTIEEVQVISNGFKAEVGRTGAGTINIITKSGTNEFPGSVYTYQKPSSFVANDLITGNESSADRQQYGATFGGPIVRDRTHFFVNWESNRIDDESVVTSALEPGHVRTPPEQRPALLQARPSAQLHQPPRRPLQLQHQRPGGERRRRAQHLRTPLERRGANLEPCRLVGLHLGCFQSQRAPGSVHPGSRGLLQPSHLRHRRRVPGSGLLAHPLPGDYSPGGGKRRAESGLSSKPGREAPASGEPFLALQRRPRPQVRRGRHRKLPLRHFFQQPGGYVLVLRGSPFSLRRRQSGDVSLPVHAGLRRLRPPISRRHGVVLRPGRLEGRALPDPEPRRAMGLRQPVLRRRQ